MAWDTSDTNEARAEASIIWLFGWVLVLPFAHPRRMLGYGVPALLILVVLTILFPSASVFGPLLATASFGLEPPIWLLPYSRTIAWIVLALSTLVAAFLICVWQRDVTRQFRDPLGQLLAGSFGRFIGYCIAPLLLAVFLVCVPILVTGGVPAGIIILVPAALVYARLSFLGPLLATDGWRGAFAGAWQAGKRHGLGHALVIISLGLFWLGALFLSAELGLAASRNGNAARAFLLADVADVAVTVLTMLWISAMPTLILRREYGLRRTDTATFD